MTYSRTVLLVALLAMTLACKKEVEEPALSGEQETVNYNNVPRRICSSLPATDEVGRKLPTHEEVGDERDAEAFCLQ